MLDIATAPVPSPADAEANAEARAVAEACVGLDPRAERDARQLAMLREMQDGGMAIQGLLVAVAQIDARRQAIAEQNVEPRPPSQLVAIGRVHASLARTVRQLIETENRIDDARWDRQAGIVREVTAARKAKASDTASSARYIADHRYEVEDALEQVIEAEAADDDARAHDLLERMYGAVEAISAEKGFLNLCIGEAVDRVSQDLRFAPDWDLLADEDWAREEADGQVEGSPYGVPAVGPRVVRDAEGHWRFSSRIRKTGPP